MITPSSEIFFKSGLAKSAFKADIYHGMPLDLYLPHISDVMRITKSAARAVPKFYQAHDAFFLFYRPMEEVIRNLKQSNKAAPIWNLIIRAAVKKKDYPKINKLTAGSTDLTVVAAVKFLTTLIEKIGKTEDLEKQARQYSQQNPNASSQLLNNLVNVVDDAVGQALNAAQSAAAQYAELRLDAEEAAVAIVGGPGGRGYALEALSVMRFLEQPDEFRRRVRLLKTALDALRHFTSTLPTTFTHQQMVSQIGGGISGVTLLTDLSKIADVLPSELALSQLGDAARMLFAVKLLNRQLLTWERAAALRPVIFVDKSGSMAEGLAMGTARYSDAVPPKISIASGLALAMYRKFDALVYLFDTEVEQVKPADIVRVLLTIQADGGTNITPVLEEIMKLKSMEYLYIIITDGITEAEESTLKRFTASGLARRTRIILIPPAGEGYTWITTLRQHGAKIYRASDVASFERAAVSSLS